MKRLVALCIILCALVASSAAQFIPPINIISTSSGGAKNWIVTNQGTNYGTTLSRALSPVSTIPVGSLVVVCFIERTNTGTSPTITDTSFNTYTSIKHQLFGSSTGYIDILSSNLTTQLTATSTITGAPVTSSNASGMLVLSANVGGTVDAAVTNSNSSAGGYVTVTSGTPGQANELFVACAGNSNNAFAMSNDGGNGWAAPFTSGGESGSGASDVAGGGGNQVNAGTGTIAFAPTLTGSAQAANALLVAGFMPLVVITLIPVTPPDQLFTRTNIMY